MQEGPAFLTSAVREIVLGTVSHDCYFKGGISQMVTLQHEGEMCREDTQP